MTYIKNDKTKPNKIRKLKTLQYNEYLFRIVKLKTYKKS